MNRPFHRICRICALWFCLVSCVFLLSDRGRGDRPTGSASTRGIAVLASSIGTDYSPEGLAQFVREGRFSPVIVDWAWITAHWA